MYPLEWAAKYELYMAHGALRWQNTQGILMINEGKFEMGVMMMPLVKCSVSNCSYWDKGNNCNADAIMIEIDQHANKKFDTEFAGESFDSEHRDIATTSSLTCCHTFKKKAN